MIIIYLRHLLRKVSKNQFIQSNIFAHTACALTFPTKLITFIDTLPRTECGGQA